VVGYVPSQEVFAHAPKGRDFGATHVTLQQMRIDLPAFGRIRLFVEVTDQSFPFVTHG
jgi:hypothetical protein